MILMCVLLNLDGCFGLKQSWGSAAEFHRLRLCLCASKLVKN